MTGPEWIGVIGAIGTVIVGALGAWGIAVAKIEAARHGAKIESNDDRLNSQADSIRQLRGQLQEVGNATVPAGILTDTTREIAKGVVNEALSAALPEKPSPSAVPPASAGDGLDEARREGFDAALKALQSIRDAGGNPNG